MPPALGSPIPRDVLARLAIHVGREPREAVLQDGLEVVAALERADDAVRLPRERRIQSARGGIQNGVVRRRLARQPIDGGLVGVPEEAERLVVAPFAELGVRRRQQSSHLVGGQRVESAFERRRPEPVARDEAVVPARLDARHGLARERQAVEERGPRRRRSAVEEEVALEGRRRVASASTVACGLLVVRRRRTNAPAERGVAADARAQPDVAHGRGPPEVAAEEVDAAAVLGRRVVNFARHAAKARNERRFPERDGRAVQRDPQRRAARLALVEEHEGAVGLREGLGRVGVDAVEVPVEDGAQRAVCRDLRRFFRNSSNTTTEDGRAEHHGGGDAGGRSPHLLSEASGA
mmetsp:Transcript_5972/g.24992  ORF Transcript_5972/g.24992 Transcript_5972/m.24992 type:complete len:350 (-) Transcript_5972:26-1075(-)